MAPFISDTSTLFEIQPAAGAQGQVVYSVINCSWTDSLCVTVSECRNDNTSMTHTAHLKTHRGPADSLSPIHCTVEEPRGGK